MRRHEIDPIHLGIPEPITKEEPHPIFEYGCLLPYNSIHLLDDCIKVIRKKTRKYREEYRENIKRLWNHRCAYCGSGKDLTVDHIKPKSRGGEDLQSNLLCACRLCNSNKGTSEVWSWYSDKTFFSTQRWMRIEHWMNSESDSSDSG